MEASLEDCFRDAKSYVMLLKWLLLLLCAAVRVFPGIT